MNIILGSIFVERDCVNAWEECDFYVQWLRAETFWNKVSSWAVNLTNKQFAKIFSIFLELSDFDDLIGFKSDAEKRMSWYWWGKLVVWEENWVQRWWFWREDSPHDCYHACKWGCVKLYTGNQLLLLWTLLFQLRLLSSCLMLLHFILYIVAYCWLCTVHLVHFIPVVSLPYNSNCLCVILCNRTCIRGGCLFL